jgi:hypothetical protein
VACHQQKKTDKKSKTEIVLERYRHNKKQREIERARISEIKKAQEERLNKHLELIERQIEFLETTKETGGVDTSIKILNDTMIELEKAKTLPGSEYRKRNAETKLVDLKKDIEWIFKRNTTGSN